MKKSRQATARKRARDEDEVPQSLVDAATEIIRDRILNLTLAPGQLINSSTLVTDLGLSRTPVREALNRLATEGLLRFSNNQGVYVIPLDIAEVYDLCEAWRVCEQIAAAFCNLAAPNLLVDLTNAQDSQRESLRRHAYLEASAWNFRQRLILAETCGNRHLLDFYRKTANQMRRLSVLVYKMEASDPDFYVRQVAMLESLHAELRAAVEQQDRAAVRASLMHHADVFRERISNILKRQSTVDIAFT